MSRQSAANWAWMANVDQTKVPCSPVQSGCVFFGAFAARSGAFAWTVEIGRHLSYEAETPCPMPQRLAHLERIVTSIMSAQASFRIFQGIRP